MLSASVRDTATAGGSASLGALTVSNSTGLESGAVAVSAARLYRARDTDFDGGGICLTVNIATLPKSRRGGVICGDRSARALLPVGACEPRAHRLTIGRGGWRRRSKWRESTRVKPLRLFYYWLFCVRCRAGGREKIFRISPHFGHFFIASCSLRGARVNPSCCARWRFRGRFWQDVRPLTAQMFCRRRFLRAAARSDESRSQFRRGWL